MARRTLLEFSAREGVRPSGQRQVAESDPLEELEPVDDLRHERTPDRLQEGDSKVRLARNSRTAGRGRAWLMNRALPTVTASSLGRSRPLAVGTGAWSRYEARAVRRASVLRRWNSPSRVADQAGEFQIGITREESLRNLLRPGGEGVLRVTRPRFRRADESWVGEEILLCRRSEFQSIGQSPLRRGILERSGTRASGSKAESVPRPLQVGQAPLGAVEAESAWFELLEPGAARGTRVVDAEYEIVPGRVALRRRGRPCRPEFQGQVDTLGSRGRIPSRTTSRSTTAPILVSTILGELRRVIGHLDDRAVDACSKQAGPSDRLESVAMLAFTSSNQRGQDEHLAAFAHGEYARHHLLGGLAADRLAAAGAMRNRSLRRAGESSRGSR